MSSERWIVRYEEEKARAERAEAAYRLEHESRVEHQARAERYREALEEVPYAITMALQWTVVPSDVPKQMHEALGLHREMLERVQALARRALTDSLAEGEER